MGNKYDDIFHNAYWELGDGASDEERTNHAYDVMGSVWNEDQKYFNPNIDEASNIAAATQAYNIQLKNPGTSPDDLPDWMKELSQKTEKRQAQNKNKQEQKYLFNSNNFSDTQKQGMSAANNYWDEANRQAENTARQNAENEGREFNAEDFWKNSEGQGLSFYKNNGVTYDSIFNNLSPEDQNAISNDNALARSTRDGKTSTWFTRNTAGGDTFSQQDATDLIGAISNDANVFNNSQYKRDDGSLYGSDYLQMMYDYNPTNQQIHSDRYGDIGLQDWANKSITNPKNLETALNEGSAGLSEIFRNAAGNNIDNLNSVTNTMTQGGIYLKSPDGQNPMYNEKFGKVTPSSLASWAKQAGASDSDVAKYENERQLENANLNTIILANELGKGNQAISKTNNDNINKSRLDALNGLINYNNNNQGYNLGQLEWEDNEDTINQNQNKNIDLDRLITRPYATEESNNYYYDKKGNGFLNTNEIYNALARAGIRKRA